MCITEYALFNTSNKYVFLVKEHLLKVLFNKIMYVEYCIFAHICIILQIHIILPIGGIMTEAPIQTPLFSEICTIFVYMDSQLQSQTFLL